MTQVNSAQLEPRELALRPRADERSLAQRRADFAAQMRAMALSELDDVATRLKDLHKRLEAKDGRRWTQQEVAHGIGIPYRTYQAWLGGKNENRTGDGYDRIVRFYRRKLGDKTITRKWLVFGEGEPVPSEAVDAGANDETVTARELRELRARVDEVLDNQATLLARLDAVLDGLAHQSQPQQPPGQTGEASPS